MATAGKCQNPAGVPCSLRMLLSPQQQEIHLDAQRNHPKIRSIRLATQFGLVRLTETPLLLASMLSGFRPGLATCHALGYTWKGY